MRRQSGGEADECTCAQCAGPEVPEWVTSLLEAV